MYSSTYKTPTHKLIQPVHIHRKSRQNTPSAFQLQKLIIPKHAQSTDHRSQAIITAQENQKHHEIGIQSTQLCLQPMRGPHVAMLDNCSRDETAS